MFASSTFGGIGEVARSEVRGFKHYVLSPLYFLRSLVRLVLSRPQPFSRILCSLIQRLERRLFREIIFFRGAALAMGERSGDVSAEADLDLLKMVDDMLVSLNGMTESVRSLLNKRSKRFAASGELTKSISRVLVLLELLTGEVNSFRQALLQNIALSGRFDGFMPAIDYLRVTEPVFAEVCERAGVINLRVASLLDSNADDVDEHLLSEAMEVISAIRSKESAT